jgi:hypothetical protein
MALNSGSSRAWTPTTILTGPVCPVLRFVHINQVLSTLLGNRCALRGRASLFPQS